MSGTVDPLILISVNASRHSGSSSILFQPCSSSLISFNFASSTVLNLLPCCSFNFLWKRDGDKPKRRATSELFINLFFIQSTIYSILIRRKKPAVFDVVFVESAFSRACGVSAHVRPAIDALSIVARLALLRFELQRIVGHF